MSPHGIPYFKWSKEDDNFVIEMIMLNKSFNDIENHFRKGKLGFFLYLRITYLYSKYSLHYFLNPLSGKKERINSRYDSIRISFNYISEITKGKLVDIIAMQKDMQEKYPSDAATIKMIFNKYKEILFGASKNLTNIISLDYHEKDVDNRLPEIVKKSVKTEKTEPLEQVKEANNYNQNNTKSSNSQYNYQIENSQSDKTDKVLIKITEDYRILDLTDGEKEIKLGDQDKAFYLFILRHNHGIKDKDLKRYLPELTYIYIKTRDNNNKDPLTVNYSTVGKQKNSVMNRIRTAFKGHDNEKIKVEGKANLINPFTVEKVHQILDIKIPREKCIWECEGIKDIDIEMTESTINKVKSQTWDILKRLKDPMIEKNLPTQRPELTE